jgi:hypothetical protein
LVFIPSVLDDRKFDSGAFVDEEDELKEGKVEGVEEDEDGADMDEEEEGEDEDEEEGEEEELRIAAR